jgi:fatty acid desaturase
MWYLDLPLVGWLVLAALGYGLVYAVLYVVARWLEYHRQHHDLVVQCRQRSLERREAAQQREQQAQQSPLAA